MGAWFPSLRRIDRISILCFLLLTLFSSSTLAQSVTLIPSAGSDTFPACALNCATLKEAQDSCVPPAAPTTNQATYVSCFCQSALLTQLHSSPNGVCDSSCTSTTDLQKLEQWYNNYCSTGGSVQTTTTASSTTSTVAAATATSSKTHVQSYPAPKSWISTHYQWVIMIIILAVGLTAIALIGMWLKRRYDAKRPGLYHGDTSTRDGARPAHPHDTAGIPSVPSTKTEGWSPSQTTPHSHSVDFTSLESTTALAVGSKSELSGASTPDPVAQRTAANSSRNSRRSTRLQKAAGPSQEGDISIHEV